MTDFKLRQQKRDETKRKVIESATRLIIERGPTVGLREIAAGAGVSTGAVFGIWENREDLFYEVTRLSPEVLRVRIADAELAVSRLKMLSPPPPA